MRKDTHVLSEVAIFVAGAVAAGLFAKRRRGAAPATSAPTVEPVALAELRQSLKTMESRLAGQEAAANKRFGQMEARLEEHSAKLAEIPSTQQIVGAMEQLLSKTMASLDERLTTQAHSIEVLKTTVTQTDSLLERVLESLDSLQNFAEPAGAPEDSLVHRPAV